VLRFREQRKLLSRSSGEDDCSSSGLSNSILASLENSKAALVTHLDEGRQAQLQHHSLLVAGEVLDVLQYEVFGSVVVAVAEVGGDKTVLEL